MPILPESTFAFEGLPSTVAEDVAASIRNLVDAMTSNTRAIALLNERAVEQEAELQQLRQAVAELMVITQR